MWGGLHASSAGEFGRARYQVHRSPGVRFGDVRQRDRWGSRATPAPSLLGSRGSTQLTGVAHLCGAGVAAGAAERRVSTSPADELVVAGPPTE
jgi:anti-sigma factor RsiW